jgi:hypothetical protein
MLSGAVGVAAGAAGAADGAGLAGAGAGAGAGVGAPKPGGRIDSGPFFCASAGTSARLDAPASASAQSSWRLI